MAKKHTTTPKEIEQLAETPVIETPAETPEPEAPAAPVIILEPWDSPKIQSFQLNWQGKEETREIGVPLTREEIQDHATKLADTVTTIQELEDEKKINADRINAAIKEQEKIQNRVSSLIRQGHDTKPVPCIWLFELAGRNDSGAFIRDPCYKTIIRKDTGAVIEVKPITNEERQMSLPLKEDVPDQVGPFDLEGNPMDQLYDDEFSLDGNPPPSLPVTEVPDDQVTQADLEAAYECGTSAHAVAELTENPYPAHTKQATAWENGWKDMDADATAGLV